MKVAKAATSGALGSGRTNLITNGSFAANTTGWFAYGSTAIARVTSEGYIGSHAMRLTAGSGESTSTALTSVTVAAGLDYRFQFRSKAATTGRTVLHRVDWYTSTGTLISTSLLYGDPNTTSGWSLTSALFTAPTGAATALYRIGVTQAGGVPPGEVHYVDAVMVTEGTDTPTYFDGATAASGTKTYAWNGAANASTSTLTDSTLGSLVPTVWRNVLGPTHDIKIDRESLNLGTLTADILDATLDPSQTTALRPGRRVRLLVFREFFDTWESLFTGKADRLDVTYDEKVTPPKPPRISLVALDPTQPLAAARRPEGVATVAELPYVLEGAGVPWRVNGSSNQVASATVVSINDNATALDQVAITRDTALGYAFVDRKGVLVVSDHPTAVALSNGTFNTNTTGWAAGASTTIARVTTPVRTGAGALRVTRNTSTGAASATTPTGTSGVPVLAGQTYTARLWTRAGATSRMVSVGLRFYNAAGNEIGLLASGVPNTTTGWTETVQTWVAPQGARYVAVTVEVAGAAASEVHYVDDVTLTLDPPTHTVDESVYSDLDLSFSSEDCINSVTVKRLAWDPDDPAKTIEVEHGPFEDSASIEQWGRRTAEFTVHGISEAGVAAYAAKILARNANPVVEVESVRVPIRTVEHLERALWDLGDLARVEHVGKGIDQTLRVDQLTHRITPRKWMVDLTFGGATSVASPQETPPVQSSSGFPDTPWITPTLDNGWTHFDGAGAPAQYRRFGGVVYLRGLLTGGADGAQAFALQPGFRGAWLRGNSHWPVVNTDGFGFVRVWSNGSVGPATTGTYVDIGSISFPAEQ